MNTMELNTRVVKEPRDFIRVIQFVFAILAFSTTAGFDGQATFSLNCPTKKDVKFESAVYEIEYPFVFKDVPLTCHMCANDTKETKYLDMEFASSAQFFVTVGVLSLLYSLASVVFYVAMAKHYETNPLLPVIDLIVTSVLSIFWLAGAIAWSFGVSDLKHYTDPKQLMAHLKCCMEDGYCGKAHAKGANWASLDVSVILGFGNVFVWSASIWFVFKETTFHRKPMPMVPGDQQYGAYPPGPQTIPQQNQFQQQQPPMQQQYTSGY